MNATLPDGTWTIDPGATTVTVTVKKMNFLDIPATLAVRTGSITISNGALSAVDVVVDAASYTSKSKARNKAVVSATFLDAKNHPNLMFNALGGGPDHVRGEATVGTKSSVLVFDVSDIRVDQGAATFTASATANRFELGVDKMPTFIIGKDLSIEISVSAKLQ